MFRRTLSSRANCRISPMAWLYVSMSRIPIAVNQKIEPGRKADTAVTRADVRKLRAATSWQPRIPLDRSLADILDYWRAVSQKS